MKFEKQVKALINLVNNLEILLYEPLYEKEYYESGHWDYVVYDHKRFLDHMRVISNLTNHNKNKKFIDVGCGIGTKVLLASKYFTSYGVELSKKYFKVAKQLNHPKQFNVFGRYKLLEKTNNIINDDALNIDYSEYDIIYFFRPIRDLELQIKLEKKIFEEAKEGTFIIPIYAQSHFPNYIKPLVNKTIFMKSSDKELIHKFRKKLTNSI